MKCLHDAKLVFQLSPRVLKGVAEPSHDLRSLLYCAKPAMQVMYGCLALLHLIGETLGNTPQDCTVLEKVPALGTSREELLLLTRSNPVG